MAESIEMPYGLRTWVGPRKNVFGEIDRAQLLVSVNLGQLKRHSVRPAAGLVLRAALSRTCHQGRDLACPWVVVTACENKSRCTHNMATGIGGDTKMPIPTDTGGCAVFSFSSSQV